MRQLSALHPNPIVRSPPLWITITTGVDELLIPRIGYILCFDREGRDVTCMRRMFVVPSKWDGATLDSERCTSRRQADPFGYWCRALHHRHISMRTMFLIVRKAVPHVEQCFLMHGLVLQDRKHGFRAVEQWIAGTIELLVRQRLQYLLVCFLCE